MSRFSHVLRNGSGAVRKKIDDVFGHTLGTNDKSELASLIYYPKEKIDYIKSLDKDTENWYKITLYRLIEYVRWFRQNTRVQRSEKHFLRHMRMLSKNL